MVTTLNEERLMFTDLEMDILYKRILIMTKIAPTSSCISLLWEQAFPRIEKNDAPRNQCF